MTKFESLVVFCHEACEILNINKLERKELYKAHFVWNFEYYTQVQERIEEYRTVLVKMGLDKTPMKILNLHFDHDERLEIYARTFEFIKSNRKYKYSVSLLEKVESDLRLESEATLKVRQDYIHEKYFKEAEFSDYVYAALASLWISFENDSVFDYKEYALVSPYALEIRRKYPHFSIDSFDFKKALKFSEVDLATKEKLVLNLIEAVKSDGRIDINEIKAYQEIQPLFNIGGDDPRRINTLEPFCALKIILSDNELTQAERDWFENKYPCESIVNTFEESMWLLSIMFEHQDVVRKNRAFFEKIWSAKKSFYNLANILFITYKQKIEHTSLEKLDTFSKHLSRNSSRKFKASLSALNEGRVIEEEILIVLNYVFSKHYDLRDLNEKLTKNYLKDLFLSLKASDSNLKHYAVAALSLDDLVINSQEYEAIWKSFSTLSLNNTKLVDAFYDVSLLKLIDYEVGEYFTYLTQKPAA